MAPPRGEDLCASPGLGGEECDDFAQDGVGKAADPVDAFS